MPHTPDRPSPFELAALELERTALHTNDELRAELAETLKRGHARAKCADAFLTIAEHHPLEGERNLAMFRARVLEGEAQLDAQLSAHLINTLVARGQMAALARALGTPTLKEP